MYLDNFPAEWRFHALLNINLFHKPRKLTINPVSPDPQNDQTYVKNLAAFAQKLLTCV